MGEDNGIYGIDKLAELLIARGIEFYVMDECSLLFVDGKGNLHECSRAGTEDLVNVMVVTTPEEALSVTDLNGVITDNAKLRELIQKVWKWERNGCYECPLEKDCKVLCVYDGDCGMAVEIEKELHNLRIELDG